MLQQTQTVSTKGQVVIPAEFRKILGIEPQTRIHMALDKKKKTIVVKSIKNVIHKLCGSWNTDMTAQEFKDALRLEEKKYEKHY